MRTSTRLWAGILLGLAALVFLTTSCASGNTPGTTGAHNGTSAVAKGTRTVIAWNPSHQDDSGPVGWHEYAVCGDIAKKAAALLQDFADVLCWETGMGLTSKNDAALRSECDRANAAHAQIFIAVHVDGFSGSGFSGEYYAGDSASERFGHAVLTSVAATMKMHYFYMVPRTDLFVLNPAHDQAPIRVLLELGDNVADRALLISPQGRQRLASALAQAVRENVPAALAQQGL